jgi:hypothetical protein
MRRRRIAQGSVSFTNQMIDRDEISGEWQAVSDGMGRPGWRYTEAEIERVKAARAACR